MAKQIEKLTPDFVKNESKPGMYPDGLGLYLQVSKWGTKSWLFRYTRHYKLRSLGLGAAHTITLLEARKRARQARQQLLDGIDPIDAKHAHREHAKLERARVMTFRQAAEAYIEDNKAGWKNSKHGEQWKSTLERYAYPIIGDLPVAAVDTGLVTKILRPIWATKTETASRLRGRIENILSWATVQHYRTGDNPARWVGHLDKLLPKRSEVQKVEHHPALPYTAIGDFMVDLRKQKNMAATALEFTILTAARTGEAIGARWEEIDLSEKLWICPAARMKAKKEHRVPLSTRAVAILKELQKIGGDFVFPGLKPDTHLSNMAMLNLLKRMERGDLTVHGFRSTFRDWAAEATNYPHEVAEMALAHTVSDETERAYRRGDLFKKRIGIMRDWEKFCDSTADNGRVRDVQDK